MVFGWINALPKPLQMIITVVGAIIGAIFISSALEQLLDIGQINPLIKMLFGLCILLITGRYALM